MSKALSSKKKDLKHHEDIMTDVLKGFIYMGSSLHAIQTGKLYDDDYISFEEYTKERWNLTRSRAYEIIEAYLVVADLESGKFGKVEVLPSVEAHARALKRCADDGEDRIKLWTESVERADGKHITAALISQIADEILPKSPDLIDPVKPAKPTPVSGYTIEIDSAEDDVADAEDSEDDEPTSSFDPAAFESEPVANDTKRTNGVINTHKSFGVLAKNIEIAKADVSDLFDSLGPLIRSIDDCNNNCEIGNGQKVLEAHYRRLFAEVEAALKTATQMQHAWNLIVKNHG